jgi:VIT1/CCC1 family predicted Fe2+/Mn2+ transporter
MTTAVPAQPGETARHTPERHRSVSGGAARAAVFGISDGLVTNVSLIVGLAGANPAPSVVRLAGIAGLVAGACSMAVGEYVSMRAQRELLERELERERHELRLHPAAEHRELTLIYQQRGLEPELAHQVATVLMRDEGIALETHAREELGIDPEGLGSPLAAATASFGSFALGAAIPLAPWLTARGAGAVVATVVLAAVTSLLVGGLLGWLAGRTWKRAALRQLGLSTLATAVAFSIGLLAGKAGLR